VWGTAAPRQAVAGQQAAGATIMDGQLLGWSSRTILGIKSGSGGPLLRESQSSSSVCDARAGETTVLGVQGLQALAQRRLPILIMHGDADECVPLELSQDLVRALTAHAVVLPSELGRAKEVACGNEGRDEDGQSNTPTLLKEDGPSRKYYSSVGVGLVGTGASQVMVGCEWAAAPWQCMSEGAPRQGSGAAPAVGGIQPAAASATLPWELHVVAGGNHRLSSVTDLRCMQRCVQRLVTAAVGSAGV
jgi:hypothetical protein